MGNQNVILDHIFAFFRTSVSNHPVRLAMGQKDERWNSSSVRKSNTRFD